MKKVLLTGATGMLGSEIVRNIRDDYEVICTSKGTKGSCGLPGFELFDLSRSEFEYDNFMAKCNPDIIIHSGAITNLSHCEKNKEEAFLINSAPLGKFAKHVSDKTKIIYISSDAVYGDSEEPHAEDSPCHPTNTYSKSKLKGEHLLLENQNNFVIIRTTPVGINPYNKTYGLTGWALDAAIRGKEINGFVDNYFSPISTTFLAKEISFLMESEYTGVFNIAGCYKLSKFDYIQGLLKELDIPHKISGFKMPVNSSLVRPKNQVLKTDFYSKTTNRRLPSIIETYNEVKMLYEEYL